MTKGTRNNNLDSKIVDLMAGTRGVKKEGKHILIEKTNKQKIGLTHVGKEVVDKVNTQLTLVRHDILLEKLLVKDRAKEIECLRKKKADPKRKYGNAIKNKRKSSADLLMKLHTRHDKQLNNAQRFRQDLRTK